MTNYLILNATGEAMGIEHRDLVQAIQSAQELANDNGEQMHIADGDEIIASVSPGTDIVTDPNGEYLTRI